MAVSRLALLSVLLAALVSASAATAKGEPTALTVCGSSGCKTFTDERTLRELGSGGGELFPDIPPASAYYTLRTRAAAGRFAETWTDFYVPKTRMLRSVGSGNWFRVGAKRAETLARLTREIAPFEPRLTAARVGDKVVREGASSYLRLFELGARADIPFSNRSMKIELRSARPSPWAQADDLLVYFPKENVLQRETRWLRVPPRVAARIERRSAL